MGFPTPTLRDFEASKISDHRRQRLHQSAAIVKVIRASANVAESVRFQTARRAAFSATRNHREYRAHASDSVLPPPPPRTRPRSRFRKRSLGFRATRAS